MDLRHGAIVVESHHPDAPAVGSVVALDFIQPYIPRHEPDKPLGKPPRNGCKVIAFVGPPHSGKSVLVCALYRQLQQHMPVEEFQREVFLLRACPDGEGNWFCEIQPELAKTLRFKNTWNDEFAAQICQNVENLAQNKRLLLVDVGGRIDRRNQRILNCCTHALIVSRDPNAVAEWCGALQAAEIKVLAEIESNLEEACEVIEREPLRLRLGPLERERRDISLPEELLAVVR
jgi:CRISPR-associated protein Csx3